ncbi:hypothetical protein WJX84_002109 [Apatococcus fuscideae]|uniref:Mediator of RNA polymerase II transcription subunit 31 n=1 Tax=Apatococcus fuscideae TaxID=2026836 RepID=A0AAW1SMR6_9CHLO
MATGRATEAVPAADLRLVSAAEIGCSDDRRFVLELEFVQGLASPSYLQWLSQNRYFEDENFLRYLEYLQYWRQPKYSKFLIYPQCLYFLDLLQDKEFRTNVARGPFKEMIHAQQFFFWQHYRGNRLKADIPVKAVHAICQVPN